MEYRRDIDGLRAIAIAAVVIYHIAPSALLGGFVGVDVFFVISGYLITGIICRDIVAGRFSTLDFYVRRIRRIVPALAVMLVVVSVLVVTFLFPTEVRRYGSSLVATLASGSNVYFFATSDYFSALGEDIPLLHTWTLAVEEQFYVVFPLLLVAFSRYAPGRLRTCVVALIALSFAVSAIGVAYFPVATFYLLPMRAWELALGAALALKVCPPLPGRWSREAAGLAGLILIALPCFFYTVTTPFPGLAALPPCLGAALIIHAGSSGESAASRLLSTAPFVFVGLISYSLYLWHWPLMVFQRTDALLIQTDSAILERSVVLAASLLAATLSFKLIEQPLRDRKRVPQRWLLAGSSFAAASLAATAVALVLGQGLAWRHSEPAQRVATYLDYDPTQQFRRGRCFLSGSDPFSDFDQKGCLPDSPGRENVLLLGDSHAAALSFGLAQSFPDANILQVTAGGCAPLMTPQQGAANACARLLRFATAELPPMRKISHVWLHARWTPDMLPSLIKTIRAFQAENIDVVLIGPVPQFQSALPRILADQIDKRRSAQSPYVEYDRIEALDRQMADFAGDNRLRYVSPFRHLCTDGVCKLYAEGGVPMYFDRDHLTESGAIALSRALKNHLADSTTAHHDAHPTEGAPPC